VVVWWWCGVVVVWCGVVWCGVVWCGGGVVWCGSRRPFTFVITCPFTTRAGRKWKKKHHPDTLSTRITKRSEAPSKQLKTP
jgi:hypothetical protein